MLDSAAVCLMRVATEIQVSSAAQTGWAVRALDKKENLMRSEG